MLNPSLSLALFIQSPPETFWLQKYQLDASYYTGLIPACHQPQVNAGSHAAATSSHTY
jgi:hypothetical protein